MAQNPIGQRERERLRGAIRQLQDAVLLITKAKACGIDCTEREEVCKVVWDQIQAFQQQFMDGKPDELTGMGHATK